MLLQKGRYVRGQALCLCFQMNAKKAMPHVKQYSGSIFLHHCRSRYRFFSSGVKS